MACRSAARNCSSPSTSHSRRLNSRLWATISSSKCWSADCSNDSICVSRINIQLKIFAQIATDAFRRWLQLQLVADDHVLEFEFLADFQAAHTRDELDFLIFERNRRIFGKHEVKIDELVPRYGLKGGGGDRIFILDPQRGVGLGYFRQPLLRNACHRGRQVQHFDDI